MTHNMWYDIQYLIISAILHKIENSDSIRYGHAATHCNTLQHTATYCNTLQHPATRRQYTWRPHCNTLQHVHLVIGANFELPEDSDNTLDEHNATHCSTLRHTATHCNTLQHTATRRQYPWRTQCNTLQHTAARTWSSERFLTSRSTATIFLTTFRRQNDTPWTLKGISCRRISAWNSRPIFCVLAIFPKSHLYILLYNHWVASWLLPVTWHFSLELPPYLEFWWNIPKVVSIVLVYE